MRGVRHAFQRTAWALKPSREGRSLLIGGRDRAVRIVNARTGALAQTLTGHRALVRCLDVSPDMSLAISGSGLRDHAVRVCHLGSGRCIRLLEGHRDGIYTVAFDADQRRALSRIRELRGRGHTAAGSAAATAAAAFSA